MTTLAERRRWLKAFIALVASSDEALCRLMAEEIGRSPWEGFTQDLQPLLASGRWHLRRGSRLLRPRRVAGRAWWQLGQKHRRHRLPLGRVAIIATWNYPVQLLGIQVIQAVMAGNEVVVKPSEHAPKTQGFLMELALRAAVRSGLGPGWIRVTAATREAGAELLESERFDHIIFTGSTAVGHQVALSAARSLTPTTLELSGRDSAIVLADADLTLAARVIWNGVVMNGGQTCMAPRRVLVESGACAPFLRELAALASAGPPRRIVSWAAARRAFDLASSAVAAGGRSLSGVVEAPWCDLDARVWMRPLVIADCPAEHPLADGDHFSPVVAVIAVRDEAEALLLHGRCQQHLATSVFTASPARWLRDPGLISRLRANLVTVNDAIVPTAHPGTSVIGAGGSGWGASQGEAGLLALTREVVVSRTRPRVRVPLAFPGPSGFRVLRRISRWLAAAPLRGIRDLPEHLPTGAIAAPTSSASAASVPAVTAPSAAGADPGPGEREPIVAGRES